MNDKSSYQHSCVLHCMKCISRDKENAILKCRGCGAVLSVRLNSRIYDSWEKTQRSKRSKEVVSGKQTEAKKC